MLFYVTLRHARLADSLTYNIRHRVMEIKERRGWDCGRGVKPTLFTTERPTQGGEDTAQRLCNARTNGEDHSPLQRLLRRGERGEGWSGEE
jgi:hypothetical protein